LSRYAILEALTPLLLSVQGGSSPSREIMLCEGVNHIRLALGMGWEYGIAGSTAYHGHDLDYGSRDSGKPMDYVLGGAERAAIYAGREVCVAGYKNIPGRPLPHCFILSAGEVEDVRAAFRRGASERWAVRDGQTAGGPTDHITPLGNLATHFVGDGGKLKIVVDGAGRVFELALDTRPQLWIKVGQERVTVGELITVNPIRLALGLAELETVRLATPVVTANLQSRQGASLQGAFDRAKQVPQPQKEVVEKEPEPQVVDIEAQHAEEARVEDENAEERAAEAEAERAVEEAVDMAREEAKAAREAEALVVLKAARTQAQADANAAREKSEAERQQRKLDEEERVKMEREKEDTAYWAALSTEAAPEAEVVAIDMHPEEPPAPVDPTAESLWELLKGTTLPVALKDAVTGEVIVPAGEIQRGGSDALRAAVYNRPLNPKDEDGSLVLSLALEVVGAE